jgi:hypothetical protein
MMMRAVAVISFLLFASAAMAADSSVGRLEDIRKPGIIAMDPPECAWLKSTVGNGPDVRALLRNPKVASLKKDEYETGAQYLSRLKSGLASLPTSKIWATSPIFEGLGTYDPERAVLVYRDFELLEPLSMVLSYKGGGQKAFYVASQTEHSAKPNSYVGQNDFGGVAKVDVIEKGVFGPAFLSVRDNSPNAPISTELNVTMDPEVARTERKNLILIMGGQLAPPFELDENSYSGATISSPISWTAHYHGLLVSPACGMIKSSKSGQIFATFLMPMR